MNCSIPLYSSNVTVGPDKIHDKRLVIVYVKLYHMLNLTGEFGSLPQSPRAVVHVVACTAGGKSIYKNFASKSSWSRTAFN